MIHGGKSLIDFGTNTGKDGGQKEKRASEDEMAGRRHRCNGHELGPTLGDSEGQGGLVCCSLWGHKESDMSGRLNNSSNITEPLKKLTQHCKSTTII